MAMRMALQLNRAGYEHKGFLNLRSQIPPLPSFSRTAGKRFTRFTPVALRESATPNRAGHLTSFGPEGIVRCRPTCAFRQEDVAVIVRTCTLLIATAGLGIALPLSAQEPARLPMETGAAIKTCPEPSVNQKLADAIAEKLRESGLLHHYCVDVISQNGTVELNGTVADQLQHEEVLHIVGRVPGVERIADRLALAESSSLTPVQAVAPPAFGASPPNGQLPPLGEPPPGTPPLPGRGFAVEPQPVFQAPAPGPYDLNPPKMPPYAWPTYAPYNNYSRVAYPTQYPCNAWPFIGPLYPFPKVPLGWRAVKLEWQDGFWWLSRYATPHDWWTLRYW
jgi:hypothetical protein